FANPFIFNAVARKARRDGVVDQTPQAVEACREERREDHVILIGYGRVGRLIAKGLRDAGRGFVVIEDEGDVADEARKDGMTVIRGSGTDRATLEEAGIANASRLLLAIPEGYEAGAIT